MSKVDNDNTLHEKTSKACSDDELIDFNLVSTASNVSNLFLINKNNSNTYEITNVNEEEMVESVLAEVVLVVLLIIMKLISTLQNKSTALLINLKLLSRKQENVLTIMTLQSIVEHTPGRKNHKI